MHEFSGFLLRASAIALLLQLGACGGRYDIGDLAEGGANASGGSAGTSGASGGTSGNVGGSRASGGSVASGGSIASGGSSVTGTGGDGAGGASCANYRVDASMLAYGTLASPAVANERIRYLLSDGMAGPFPAPPDAVTPGWAAQTVDAYLDSMLLSDLVPGGVERFMRSWLGLHDANVAQTVVASSGALFTRADGTFSQLIAPTQRTGLLEDPALNRYHTSISNRGAFLFSSLFCAGIVPPLNSGDITGPIMGTPTLTRRQVLASVTSGTACAVCHSLVDSVGASLEVIDPTTGARRSVDENGLSIDASGTLSTVGSSNFGQTYTFTSIDDLAPELASSCEVARCFVTSYVNDGTAALGLPALGNDELEFVIARFAESNLSLRELARAFVQTPTFLQ